MHQQLDASGKHQLDARLQYWRFQVFLAGANLVRSTQKLSMLKRIQERNAVVGDKRTSVQLMGG